MSATVQHNHSDTLNSQTANPWPDIPQCVQDEIRTTSMRNRIRNSETADFPSQQTPMQFTDTHDSINDERLSTQDDIDYEKWDLALAVDTYEHLLFHKAKHDGQVPCSIISVMFCFMK